MLGDEATPRRDRRRTADSETVAVRTHRPEQGLARGQQPHEGVADRRRGAGAAGPRRYRRGDPAHHGRRHPAGLVVPPARPANSVRQLRTGLRREHLVLVPVLEGSPYAFPAEQYDIVRRLLTDGICRSVWQGTMDPSFCGRQVFIDAGRGKALSLAVTARNMAATGRPGNREFARIAKRNLRPGGRGCGQQLLLAFGLRHPPFETMVRLRADALRTHGRIRDDQPENLLANFSADGALLTMQHGAEYENIFACWDWRRVPGTTAYDDGAPIKCSDDADEKRNRSRWVGGLAADDLLCTTMELRRDSLRAVKSNFLFEEIVVALGSGIRNDAPPRELFTTMEQNRLRGEVVAGTSGGRLSIPEERPTGRSFRPGEVQWIHHDGRGYLLLDEQEVRLSTAMQHGKWGPDRPLLPRPRGLGPDLQMLGGAPLRHGRQLCLCDPALPECEADGAHGSQTPGGAPAQRRRLPGREIRPHGLRGVPQARERRDRRADASRRCPRRRSDRPAHETHCGLLAVRVRAERIAVGRKKRRRAASLSLPDGDAPCRAQPYADD